MKTAEMAGSFKEKPSPGDSRPKGRQFLYAGSSAVKEALQDLHAGPKAPGERER